MQYDAVLAARNTWWHVHSMVAYAVGFLMTTTVTPYSGKLKIYCATLCQHSNSIVPSLTAEEKFFEHLSAIFVVEAQQVILQKTLAQHMS